MSDTTDLRERTISRLRELSDAKLAVLQQFIDELASEPDVYVLSEEEHAVLEPEIAGADAGDFATDEEVARSILRPWK